MKKSETGKSITRVKSSKKKDHFGTIERLKLPTTHFDNEMSTQVSKKMKSSRHKLEESSTKQKYMSSMAMLEN